MAVQRVDSLDHMMAVEKVGSLVLLTVEMRVASMAAQTAGLTVEMRVASMAA